MRAHFPLSGMYEYLARLKGTCSYSYPVTNDPSAFTLSNVLRMSVGRTTGQSWAKSGSSLIHECVQLSYIGAWLHLEHSISSTILQVWME